MVSKMLLGLPAVVVGILIAATEALNLMGTLNYLWAVLVLLWGVMALAKKEKKKIVVKKEIKSKEEEEKEALLKV